MIFLICRWRHRRRMDQLNSRERFLDYTPSEIHAEHVGGQHPAGKNASWTTPRARSTLNM